jgi:hypothetical protein
MPQQFKNDAKMAYASQLGNSCHGNSCHVKNITLIIAK